MIDRIIDLLRGLKDHIDAAIKLAKPAPNDLNQGRKGLKGSGEEQRDPKRKQIIKAVRMLESDRLETRLLGITELEELARDSKDRQRRIIEALTACVRRNSPWYLWKSYVQSKDSLLKPGADIQSILEIVAHYKRKWNGDEDYPIDLSRTDLRGADLRRARLEWANLQESHLENADMVEANLHGAFMAKTSIKKVRLPLAELAYAFLEYANMEGADLRNANLKNARLIKANLKWANLGAFIDPEGRIHGSANLEGANLEGANLQNANLSGVNMSGANLWGAKLQGANFDAAILKDANLSYTKLKGAKNLTAEQLSKVKTLYLAKLDPQLMVEVSMKAPQLLVPTNIFDMLKEQ
ncbi:MAG: pentapeptide repeat-containing protein [Candidatus Dadabacteria bacterium]|nr:pentapeptide repeat-containing protein [Candidatus Dadabacteria bacterium]